MAYETSYGTGELGDVTITDGAVQNVNSYARVVAISGNAVTIDTDNLFEGAYEKFRAGVEVLIHVSATNGADTADLGRYLTAKITLAQNGVLTLDRHMFNVDLDKYYVQAVTFANFDCLTLGRGAVLTPQVFNPFNFYGGILAIKVWDALKFEGGSIDLTDAGIPAARKNQLRPLTTQETAANGESDYALYSGWENHITADRFLLNAGDGAAFIVAKKLVCHPDSRIGNPKTHGAQYCRGASNSVGVKPSNITNIGGSTILIAAESIVNFTPKLIAKYRDAGAAEGRGLCRCYIASETKLRNDEGLYAFDVLANPKRLQSLGVRDFGDGSFGDMVNPEAPLNNYMQVIRVQNGGHQLTILRQTAQGLAQIRAGALVLVQAVQKYPRNCFDAGKFTVARVIKRNYDVITIDTPAPEVNLDNYHLQIIAVPQFQNFTLANHYAYTVQFNKLGGVFAIAVNGTCDLRGGKIDMEACGCGVGYGADGLSVIGNAQNCDRLPLGAGYGSIFILAREIMFNDNTRLGALYSGGGTGSRFGGNNSDGSNQGGGYSGAPDENNTGAGGGYVVGGAGSQGTEGILGASGAGSGSAAGSGSRAGNAAAGGIGSNGQPAGKYAGGSQGSHVMIIADRISGMTVANLSTGGEGGQPDGKPGACGYGGGGAISGGGSSGFAFVYANQIA